MIVAGGVTRPDPARFAAAALTAVLLLVAAWEAAIVWPAALTNPVVAPGMDVGFYLERTQDWLDGEGFYLPRQLTGEPYVIDDGDSLYPPPSVLLFLPWTLGAPMVLWWAIPLAVIAAALWKVRPPWWAWPILAAVLVYPRTWTVLVLGNPSMWALAAIAAGSAWGWPAVGAMLKPVMAPFALVGLRRDWRSWMVAIAVVLGISALFLPMWPDYVTVLLDAQNTRGPEYTLGEMPIALLLAAAMWPTASRRRAHP